MAITASKPAINIREKLSELDQPQGIKGTEVLRADTADEARNAIGARGRKNLIINGAMNVAQRGTSSTANGYVSLDRWYANQSGGSTTFSQETNASPSTTGGVQKYARFNVSSSSDYTNIRQRIEDVTSVSGVYTLSFYAKGTAPVGGLYTWWTQSFGSGGSSDVDSTGILITTALTSSWTRYTVNITIPSIDGKTIGTGSFLNLGVGQYSNSSSTAYDLNITNFQLELGNQATDFEHRSYGEELALCQRYFYTPAPINSSHRVLLAIVATGSTTAFGIITHPVTMRSPPTLDITLSGGSYRYRANLGTVNGNSVSTNPTLGAGQDSVHNARVEWSSGFSGLTADKSGWVTQGDGTNGYFGFDAEL
jgi:hypothetical protein